MTSAQVFETSVTSNSSFQNYTHPDDHTIRTKNEFDIHEKKPQGGTHFQKNGFALLTQAKTNSEMAHRVQLAICHTLLLK